MDKAILGAAVAIAIFTCTQIILHIRDRQALLRSRLEELFDAINEISFSLMNVFRSVYNHDHEANENAIGEAVRNLDKSLYKPRTLVLLYFPYFVEVWEKFHVGPIRKFVAIIANRDCEKKDPSTDEIQAHVEELCLKLRYSQNFLSRNQALTTETLGFHLRRLFKRKVPIYMVGPQNAQEPSLHPPQE